MGIRRSPIKKPASKSSANISKPSPTSAGITLQRSRLPVDFLKQGMRVVKLDRPWTEVPVLFQGFTIESDAQARLLRQYCEWVVVESDEVLVADALAEASRQKQITTEPLPETRPLSDEIPRAFRTWKNAQKLVESITQSIEHGFEFRLEEARPIISECVSSIQANASAMFWMSRVKSRDAYTAEHCLRVAILTVAFARFLGLPDDDLEVAGMCGLLHDLGKLKVPDRILNKPGSLNAEELSIMKQHTVYGYELLSADKSLDPIIADVSRHHHERIDGAGYPHQLEEWQISRFARIVAIIDAFDAMTSDRCYRDGIPASAAIRILYQNRGSQFDAGMVEAFIRMVGIYPPGTLVELSTGEVALIVAVHPGKKLRPRVEILLDSNKTACDPRIIDLSDPMVGEEVAILHPLPDGAHGLTLEARIEQMVRQTPTMASTSR